MRAKTLQILWHEKMPVFSVDIYKNKLASSGGDNCVRVWDISNDSVEFLSTLNRHSAPVNSVQWSSTGLLASGSDGCVL